MQTIQPQKKVCLELDQTDHFYILEGITGCATEKEATSQLGNIQQMSSLQ